MNDVFVDERMYMSTNENELDVPQVQAGLVKDFKIISTYVPQGSGGFVKKYVV